MSCVTTVMRQFVITILCCMPFMVHAQSIDDIADHFFLLLKQGQTDQAIDSLMATSKWLAKDSDGIVGLRSNLARSNKLFGKYLFNELISNTSVGEHYVHRIYLVGFERQPLSCKLSFYKPGNQWQIQNISFGLDFVEDINKQAEALIVK